jgi:hypothetical protein
MTKATYFMTGLVAGVILTITALVVILWAIDDAPRDLPAQHP